MAIAPAPARAAATGEAEPVSLRPGETLAGWGGVPVPGREVCSEDLASLTRDVPLTRGLGRSYGDSSLPPPSRPLAANSTRADRILGFDETSGILRAEAGLSLETLRRVFLPRGWFVPVTPGTQFVTLGGAVAADVHGKNHHVAGCFGAHVTELTLRVADGRVVRCAPDQEPELFRATVGGMGLTGHILDVSVRMVRVPSPWILQESRRIPGIDAFLDALEEAARVWPFTVGWIDCLSRGKAMGRGILIQGRWAGADEAPAGFPGPLVSPSVPFAMPELVLNPLSIRAFNELYYRRHVRRVARGVVHPDAFFYPLDGIRHWNRLYGRRGFTQYQAVIPRDSGRAGVRRFLDTLTRQGAASFLAVIKDCGPEGTGTLSFPRPGISVALDIPVRDGTQRVVDALNERVIEEGGRIYLAKDAFTRPEHFRRMEPRLEAFLAVRDRWDPQRRIRSAQSVRLFGDPA
jgi:decaprenylphospho-beta-D-ribofuranose 2-oxidase